MWESGQIISKIRQEKGLTQSELAMRAAVPQSNLSNIEMGKRDLTVSTLKRIARALDVPAARLLDEPRHEPAASSESFTRARVERIASAVVTDAKSRSSLEAEIVSLLRYLSPETGKGRFSSRTALLSWSRLKTLISPIEIKTILEKIRDAAQRKV